MYVYVYILYTYKVTIIKVHKVSHLSRIDITWSVLDVKDC